MLDDEMIWPLRGLDDKMTGGFYFFFHAALQRHPRVAASFRHWSKT
jgi:hypothetical protein